MLRRTALAAGLTTCLAAAVTVAPFGTASAETPPKGPTVVNDCITSVPDPGTTEPVEICYTLFKPAGARPKAPVPMLMHSHGWGGSRTTDPASFQEFLDAGYGVLSFDQRGFGESGGQAHVENPQVEGHDVRGLVKLVSKLGWVAAGRSRRPADGRGRRQLRRRLPVPHRLREAAHHRQAGPRRARTRDHLERPQPEPRARGRGPHRVGAGAERRRACRPTRCRTTSTRRSSRARRPAPGPTAASPAPRTSRSSSSATARSGTSTTAAKLDIPVLFGQGTTDGLFNLQQGLTNWRTAITDRGPQAQHLRRLQRRPRAARRSSRRASTSTSDPCSKKLAGGDFRRAVDPVLRRDSSRARTPGSAATASSTSPLRTAPARPSRRPAPDTDGRPRHGGQPDRGRRADRLRDRARAASASPGRRTSPAKLTATARQPRVLRPRRRHLARRRAPGPEQRDADQRHRARRRQPERPRSSCPPSPSTSRRARRCTSWSSAVSDTFVGMSSRVPGVVVLDETKVHLPVVD